MRADGPQLSVVITAYQAAGTIVAAVESALEQTRPAAEVLVVDDGSTDDLAGALAPFGERIRTIRRANGGGAAARNSGARAARGEFMAILDADDTFEPGRLDAIASLAATQPHLDLIATDASFVVGTEKVGSFLAHNPFPASGQREAIFASCFPSGWPAVRISALEAVGGFDEQMRIAYDWDCWLRMILAGSRAGMVAEPLYNYVLHEGSLASSRLASLRERVALLEKATRNPHLRPAERPALERSLRLHRERAARATIEAALYGDASRRELAALTTARGIPPRVRSLAAIGAMLPPLARRVVAPAQPPEQRFAPAPK